MKTSCLKCATSLVKDLSLEMEKKLDLTLGTAKRLEEYLRITPTGGGESLPGESPDAGHLEEEF